jgi:Domain of unknown function (DUF3850)
MEIKILAEFYHLVSDGTKTFEVRFNDRDYQVGDVLVLKDWTGTEYTGHQCTVQVTYVLQGGQYGIEAGYVVLGIKLV